MSMAAVARQEDPDIGSGAESVLRNLKRGLVLGTGKSASLGWYEVKGFDRERRSARSSKLIISCGVDERDYVFDQTLRHTQCRADENEGDTIYTVIEIVPCLTS